MPRDSTTLEALPAADLALVRALRAWGESAVDRETADPPALLRWFGSDQRAKLAGARAATNRESPESAWQALRADQATTYRFDPTRIHPSWFVRLFETESPAVQWVVAEHAPEPLRALLRHRFCDRLRALDPHDGLLRVTGPAHPDAPRLVTTFWTERLVGDRGESAHDPPVIVALTQLPMPSQVRLLRAIGQAKQAFGLRSSGPTALDEEQVRYRPNDRVRVAYFRRTLGRVDPRLAESARRDLQAVAASPRQRHAAVGLVTVARLLREVDPHRARWAVQHLPYPIARTLGALGRVDPTQIGLSRRAIVAWESWIITAAWARLLREEKLATRPRSEDVHDR